MLEFIGYASLVGTSNCLGLVNDEIRVWKITERLPMFDKLDIAVTLAEEYEKATKGTKKAKVCKIYKNKYNMTLVDLDGNHVKTIER